MSKLSRCLYGGGRACMGHGGDGVSYHSSDYTHSYPAVAEVGGSAEGVVPLAKGMTSAFLTLEDHFDNDIDEAILALDISEPVNHVDFVRKSLYDFDLDTTAGVKRLLELLPILDSEILKDVVQEVWPGYPIEEDFDPKVERYKVRGYLLDYLDGHGR